MAIKTPEDSELFSDGGNKVNVTFLRRFFAVEGKLSMKQILKIIKMGTDLLHSESNLLITDAPITSNLI